MRSSPRTAGCLAVCALVTVAVVGCGTEKAVSVQGVDGSSLPTMPMPMPGSASLAGRVRDADGNGVPGATIKVAETDGTTTTNVTGDYQMMVPSDSTVTLLTTAPGFASNFRESIVLANQAAVADFDILVLSVDTVSRLDGLGNPALVTTRGLMAVRLHSLSQTCVIAGARVSIWPPQAATVMYSQPNTTGGLEEPDAGMDSVQAGTGIGVWLLGVIPPGNQWQIEVNQTGCRQLTGSPSMGGMLFPGLRRVDAQVLTEADLFFE